MSWFTPLAGLKKKICRYLLQRYLGQFLEEKLNLEQLNVDLYNGRGTVDNVALNCEALNELCESQGWGIEVTGGHIGSVTVVVPWNALMKEDSSIEVSNLHIALKPLPRQTDGTSMFESMWSSMSSSLQLAQECLEKDEDIHINAQNATIEGLEKFAQTIDSVLNRIKAKFINTEIRLEYLPPNSDQGIAVIIKIDRLDYQNEAGSDPIDTVSTDLDNDCPEGQKTHLISSYATHHITIEGITFYTEEFRIQTIKPHTTKTESMIASQQFYSTISQLPETEQYLASENYKRTERDQVAIESDDTDDESDVTVEICSSDNIQIISIEGKQEIRIKMKQSENVYGPKVELDLQFGACFIFLSPRQLHLVTTFCDVFVKDQQATPKTESIESKRQRSKEMQKNLQKQRYNSMSGGIGNEGCWSDPVTENKQQYHKDTGSTFRDSTKDFGFCESVSSSMTSSSTTCSSRFRQKPNSETTGDISHFNIRIVSILAILLHEDILLESSISEMPLSEESVSKLKELSVNFFSPIHEGLKQRQSCEKNHLKLALAPVIIEGEEHRAPNVVTLKFTSSIIRADFEEVLQDVATPLIDFQRNDVYSTGLHKRPEVVFNFKMSTPTRRGTKGKKISVTKTDIHFTLEKSSLELDVSLYDRLSAILSASPFVCHTAEYNKQEGSPITSRHIDPVTEIKLESPSLDIRLRFPIADTRPIHNPDRIPWWKQNIRPDYLLFVLSQFRLKYASNSVEITANEIDLHYCESSDAPKIHVGKSTLVDHSTSSSREPYIDYPRIVISFPTEKSLKATLKCSLEDSDSGETSGESCALFPKKNRESLPFCSKRVCRQSDTPHTKDDIDKSETILLPGETAEMRKFCEKAMKTSKLQFKVFLPIASVQINSKHLYEILYNRLNTDLLMWEPRAPSAAAPAASSSPSLLKQSLLNVGMMESMYVPPPSAETNEENDSGSSCSSENADTDCDSDNLYYSAYDRKRTKRSQPSSSVSLSSCSFELDINEGLMTLFAPVRDSENRVIPGQLGEFIFKANGFNLFSVSGFNGNSNVSYLCIQSQAAEVYHCGLIPQPTSDMELRLITSPLPSHVQYTLYPTPDKLTLSGQRGGPKREQVSFVVEIKRVPEQRIKRLRITTGIQNTTLKHNPALSQHTWLNQMIDMFDVIDYPIEGYKPYGIVTELQLHIWDCAIDYRPLNFEYRAVAELGNFTISSNLTTSISGCTLRFIAEDCALCLAPYDHKKHEHKSQNRITVLPSNNLVSVLDLGLLDISLRINEKATDLFPKFDMRASIQDMHIRTCSDSGHALAQLIAYLAVDGDLNIPNEDESSHQSHGIDEEDLLSVKESRQEFPEITEQQQERVNILMAEALQEHVSIQPADPEDDLRNATGVEVFFFPDETQQLKRLEEENELKSEESEVSSKYSSTVKSNFERNDSDSPEILISNVETPKRSNSEEWRFKPRRESESSNELRDILNFETSVMSKSYMADDDVVEALPQVKEDLGEVISLSPPKQQDKSRKSSFSLEDDFYLIAEEEKAYMSKCGIKDIKISQDPLRIVDNHFSLPLGKPDLLKAPENFPMAVMRYTLCEMTLTWHLYGGHDFPEPTDSQNDLNKKDAPRTSQKSMSDAYKMGVSYSKGQQNVNFAKPKPITKISWKTKGGPNRKHDVLIEIQLTKVRLSHEIYPTHVTQASRQVLVISELEIRDRLQSSEINKFLYHPTAKHLPNKSSQHMVVIKALHVRPNPLLAAQECSLRISLLPLRLNIDQDALLFLVQFFNELSASEDDDNPRKRVVQKAQPPVMMVDDLPEAVQDLQARKLVSTNLDLLMEGDENKAKNVKEPIAHEGENNLPIYFKEIIFSPEVLIRLDYHGRRIEMSRGPIAGLLMGLGQLQCSEIRLKKIYYKHGILGVDRLLNFLFKEWLQDIKKNQLPAILSGVGPMYTFVQLFQGIRDLFWLPIEQYQKDGRIVRGLQLGAQSFTARTALAALEITSRIIQLLQITAETAFDMVSPGPSVRRGRHNRRGKRKRPHRPQDIREGVANAYQIVRDGLNDTANTLIETTAAEHDQKGYTGAVGAVFRQIPPIVVCPVVLATQATTNVLGGVKNQLVPDARFEAREKWKDDTD